MKVLGRDDRGEKVFVEMTFREWAILQDAAGVLYDKRSKDPGTSVNATPIEEMNSTFYDIKTMRKEIGSIQTKWDKLATRLDAIVKPEGKT